jgi:HEAT repeat protein
MPKLFSVVALSFALVLAGDLRSVADDVPPEIAKLIKQLSDKDAVVRLKAAKELGNLKEKAKDAIPALTVATSDSDEDVRAVAKRALAAIKEATGAADAAKVNEQLAPLIKSLQSKDIKARLKAIAELELLGADAKPAGAALVEFGMMNPNAKVREAANAAYEKIDPEIYKEVLTIFIDADKSNKYQAVDNLRKMGAKAKAAVPMIKSYHAHRTNEDKYPPYFTLQALMAIVPEDAAVQQAILGFVAASDNALPISVGRTRIERKTLIDDMRSLKIDTKKQVEALLAGLSASKYERALIIRELGKMGSDAKAALPVLMSLKTDSEKEVREAATAAIEAIKE